MDKDLRSYFKKKRNIVSLIIIAILLVAVPTTLYLAQTRQIFKPKASYDSCSFQAQQGFDFCVSEEERACNQEEDPESCADIENGNAFCHQQQQQQLAACSQQNPGGVTGGTISLNASPVGVCGSNGKEQI